MSCSADNSLCIGYLDGQTSKGHAVLDAGPAAPSGRTADRKRPDFPASHAGAAREKDSGVGTSSCFAAVAPAPQNSNSCATAAVALVNAAPASSASASVQVAQHQRALRLGPVNNDVQQTSSANVQKENIQRANEQKAALRERSASTLIERPPSLPPPLLQEASIPPVRLPTQAAESHLNELWADRDAQGNSRVPNADVPVPVHAARARSPKQNCSFAAKCKSFFSKRFSKVASPISN